MNVNQACAVKEPYVPIYLVVMSVPVQPVSRVTLKLRRVVLMWTNAVKQIVNFAALMQTVLIPLEIISVNVLKGIQVTPESHA